MIGIMLLNHRKDLTGNEIRWKFDRRGDQPWPGFPERLAILLIVVPRAAKRIFAVHQHLVGPAHFAIKVLHAQLLAALGVGGELRA